MLEFFPEIFEILANDFDTEKYEEGKNTVLNLLEDDRLCYFVGSGRRKFQDALVAKYNESTNSKCKILYLIFIINNTYRNCHQAKEIQVFKDALMDDGFKNTAEVADLTINYLMHLDLATIDGILETAHRVVFDKKSLVEDVGREGLIVLNLIQTKVYDFYPWMEKAFNIILEAKFRNKKIREKVKHGFSEFWKTRSDGIVYKQCKINEEILGEVKGYCKNFGYFA